MFRPTSNPIHRTQSGKNNKLISFVIQKSFLHFELMNAVNDVNNN